MSEPTFRQHYHELAQAVAMIREAVELTFGPITLPPKYGDETPIRECELIARAIYAAGARRGLEEKRPPSEPGGQSREEPPTHGQRPGR